MKYYFRLMILFLPLALLLSVLYEQVQITTGLFVLAGLGIGIIYTIVLFYIFKFTKHEIV